MPTKTKRRTSKIKSRKPKKATASKALALAKLNKLFLFKTIENKQVSALRPSIFVTTAGYDAQTVGDTIQPTSDRDWET